MARRTVAPTTNVGWAALWLSQGFHVVPLFPKSKKPCGGKDWHRKALFGEVPADELAEVFAGGNNVGLLMGTPDGRRVDADFDCPEVRQLRTLLPATGLTFGRVSLDGVTHCIYEAEEHEEGFTEEVYYDYIRNGRREAHKLLELRYTGRQTMAPGSIHPDTGEPIICGSSPPAKPAVVSLARLRDTCRLMAAITIVKRQWPGKGSRDDYAMWVLGGLIWHGVPAGRAQEIVTRAAALAGDEEYRKRGSSANRAADKVATGAHVRGFGHLETVFDLPGFGKALLDALRHNARKEKIEDTGNPVELGGNKTQPPPRTQQPGRPNLLIQAPYVPFPVHALPDGMREMVEAISEARNVDPAMVASPSITGAASLIGTTHRITPNRDWYEDCAIWTIVVCDSGTRKTPAFGAALAYIEEEQARLSDVYRAARAADVAALAEWRAADREERGDRPAPTAIDVCLVTNDATIEAIARVLVNNPRGCLYAAEEIDNWFQSLTRYNNSTAAYYLQLYSARLLSVRRADPNRDPIVIARALVNLCGTIQPGVFQAAMTEAAVASGLLARPLICWPDAKLNLFQRFPRTVDELQTWRLIQQRLYQLQGVDARTPRDLMLCNEAIDLFAEWNDRHAHKVFNALAGAATNADNKLFGTALRLALVHHLITCVHRGTDTNSPVSVESIQAALELVCWWSNEHARIYGFLEAAPASAPQGLEARIIRYFRRRPECPCASGRDLQRALSGPSHRVTQEDIQAACTLLQQGGWGSIAYVEDGDTQRIVFTFNRNRDDPVSDDAE